MKSETDLDETKAERRALPSATATMQSQLIKFLIRVRYITLQYSTLSAEQL